MCVKRGTANMGQWSAKLTFHFNLALGEWEGGGEFQELGNLHISIEFIHFLYTFLNTFYRTQVSLGSDLWVRFSLTD